MYNIAIRADGGSAVGMGHIMRCLAISEQLKNIGCRVYFLGRYSQGLDKVKDKGFDAFEILVSESEFKCNTPEMKNLGTHNATATGFNYGSIEELEEDVFATLTIIRQQGCDLLLVDKYNLTSAYFVRLKEFIGKVAFIDDLNLFKCSADIIINGNINANELGYRESFTKQKLLLGTKYTPLRSEFSDFPKRKIKNLLDWQYMPQKSSRQEMSVQADSYKGESYGSFDSVQVDNDYDESQLPEIMITTGGADPYNCTGRLLELLLSDDKTACYRYNVIVSSGFVYKDEIIKIANNNSNIVLYKDYKYLSEVMLRSDLAISSGGSTLYELCCCGTPTMAFIMADNQAGIVDKLSRDGYIKALGWYSEIDNPYMIQQVYDLVTDFQLRNRYSEKMQSLVDGRGAFRIAESLIDSL